MVLYCRRGPSYFPQEIFSLGDEADIQTNNSTIMRQVVCPISKLGQQWGRGGMMLCWDTGCQRKNRWQEEEREKGIIDWISGVLRHLSADLKGKYRPRPQDRRGTASGIRILFFSILAGGQSGIQAGCGGRLSKLQEEATVAGHRSEHVSLQRTLSLLPVLKWL